MKLFDKIRKICQEKHITISELEKAAGLKENSIYRWNRITPAVDKVINVARVLNITVEELAEAEADR